MTHLAHYFEEQTDIKLIILFITDNFKCPVTSQQIVEAALEKDILNYFDLAHFQKSIPRNPYVLRNAAGLRSVDLSCRELGRSFRAPGR